MGLESILLSDTMGIFRKKESKHPASKGGIAAATAFVSALTGAPVHAQDNQYQQAVEMTPEIQQQMDRQKVPEFLAETMFKRIPNANNIVRAFNGDEIDSHKISYIMDPTDDNWAERGVINNMGPLQLGMEDIQKPEYWVLLKLSTMDKDQSDYWYWNGGSTYSRIFGNLSDRINDEGVKHMATALQNNMWGNSMKTGKIHEHETEREEHLLKALYYGATGSDNGVEPILNGQYQQIPEVKNLVQEWKEKHNYSPYTSKGNALNAYLSLSIDNKPKDRYLTSLAFTLLIDFYSERDSEKSNIYSVALNSSNSLPDFRIEKENKIVTPFDIFN